MQHTCHVQPDNREYLLHQRSAGACGLRLREGETHAKLVAVEEWPVIEGRRGKMESAPVSSVSGATYYGNQYHNRPRVCHFGRGHASRGGKNRFCF